MTTAEPSTLMLPGEPHCEDWGVWSGVPLSSGGVRGITLTPPMQRHCINGPARCLPSGTQAATGKEKTGTNNVCVGVVLLTSFVTMGDR